MASGLEIEIGSGAPSWAAIGPLDKGTRRVVMDGCRVLYDPDALLRLLIMACDTSSPD